MRWGRGGVLTFIAWFVILFTGRYPKGMFDFVVGVRRWNQNVSAYILLLRDEYPPFSMERGLYPVTYDVEYPERLSRLLIFVKWLLVIPNVIVLAFLGVAVYVTSIVAWFAILFTGRYPERPVQVRGWSDALGRACQRLRRPSAR